MKTMRTLIVVLVFTVSVVSCGPALTRPTGMDIKDAQAAAGIKTIGIVGPLFDPSMRIAGNDGQAIADAWRADLRHILEQARPSVSFVFLNNGVLTQAVAATGFSPEDKYDPRRGGPRLDYQNKMARLAGVVAKEQGLDAALILYFDRVKIAPNPSLARPNLMVSWDGAEDINKDWDSYEDIPALSLSALLVRKDRTDLLWSRRVGYKIIEADRSIQEIMEDFPNNEKMCLMQISNSLIGNLEKK